MAKVNSLVRSAQQMTATIYTGNEGLEEVRDIWSQIAVGMERKRIFHDIRWYQSYLDVLEQEPERVHFFVIWADSVPIALLPLRRYRIRRAGIPVRILKIPSHNFHPYSDFLITERQDMRLILNVFIRTLRTDSKFSWDVLHFPRTWEDSKALALFRDVKGYLIYHQQVGTCDYIPCPSGKDPLTGLPKNLRKQLRKAKKKLSALGSNDIVSFREGMELAHAFQTFLDIEASGWKGKAGSAIKCIPNKERLFRRLVELFSVDRQLEISILQAGGKAIGGNLAIWSDDTCYYLKIARDQTYDEVSPGHLLTQKLYIKCSQSDNVDYLNLVSDSDWHKRWHPSKYAVYDHHICNRTIGGLAQFAALASRNFLNKMK